ncbi:hypothetical protein [Thermocrinis albus]|nr:hypothetical protein [Thermocrinis albus]
MLKGLLTEDIPLKLIALTVGFSLWFVVNFGTRVPVTVEKPVEILHPQQGFSYHLSVKKVKIKLLLIERLMPEDVVEGVKAYVDVRGLSEGSYTLKVQVETPFKFLAFPESVHPEYVKVKISKAPPEGDR